MKKPAVAGAPRAAPRGLGPENAQPAGLWDGLIIP